MDTSTLVTAETVLPRVSVIVGNYNQSEFVADTIRSIAAQSYTGFECVIVDDASSDESAETIATCLSDLSDSRFRFVKRESNGGQTATLMTGFSETSGQFVAFVDADDLWLPDFLDRHVMAHLSRTASAAVSASDTGLIDREGAIIAGGNPLFRNNDLMAHKPRIKVAATESVDGHTLDFISPGMVNWLWSQTSAMVFRRSVLAKIWPLEPGNVRICSDEYLAVLAHLLGGTIRIDSTLGHYRMHGGNNWTNTDFMGSFDVMDFRNADVKAGIRSETIRTLCSLARDSGNRFSQRYIARALTNYVGTLEAIRMSEMNSEVRELLSDYLTPRRRTFAAILRHLPEGLQPRRFRPIHRR